MFLQIYEFVVIVYKSKNDLTAEFLVDLFSPNVASISQYNLRNDDYVILNRRTQFFCRLIYSIFNRIMESITTTNS